MLDNLSIFSAISVLVLVVVYFLLITEKLPKVVVAILGGVSLILMQVFRSATGTSQENAFTFIAHNLDILGFVIGMMVLVGIVRQSGVFEALAIWLVQKIGDRPGWLLVALGYLTLLLTALFSNIPTVLILTPVIIVLVRELKLPPLPFLFTLISMANLGGAITPISDPTTYYQAKTVGLSFLEVVQNSGLIVLVLSVVNLCYILTIFRRPLRLVKLKKSDLALFRPRAAIRDQFVMRIGLPLIIISIALMVFKEQLRQWTGLTLDNATITIGSAFLAILIFHQKPRQVFRDLIDWEIIFFFIGLFVVVGSLEFTHVIGVLAQSLVELTAGNLTWLLLIISVGSGVLSTFIDNVP